MILNTFSTLTSQLKANLLTPLLNKKNNVSGKSSIRLLTAISVTVTLSAITVPANACQIPKSYYSNVFCTANSNYFLALKDSGQPVALINNKGKRVANLMHYDSIDVSKFNEGLVPVQRLGRVGYINSSGIEVIPAIYQVMSGDKLTKGWSRAAINGRIVVKKQGKFGVINTQNKVIVPFSTLNKSISDFKENVAKVETTNGTRWIDINGNPVTEPTNKPKESSAVAATSSSGSSLSGSATGSLPNPNPITTSPAMNQSQNPAQHEAQKEVWVAEQRDYKWGFVDSNNVPMIKFLFDQVTPFSEGLAGVRMEDKWGFVNLAGELVIPFEFAENDVKREEGPLYKGKQPFEFIQGKAWVANNASGAKICINKEGKYVNCQ